VVVAAAVVVVAQQHVESLHRPGQLGVRHGRARANNALHQVRDVGTTWASGPPVGLPGAVTLEGLQVTSLVEVPTHAVALEVLGMAMAGRAHAVLPWVAVVVVAGETVVSRTATLLPGTAAVHQAGRMAMVVVGPVGEMVVSRTATLLLGTAAVHQAERMAMVVVGPVHSVPTEIDAIHLVVQEEEVVADQTSVVELEAPAAPVTDLSQAAAEGALLSAPTAARGLTSAVAAVAVAVAVAMPAGATLSAPVEARRAALPGSRLEAAVEAAISFRAMRQEAEAAHGNPKVAMAVM
jgi:hypothetical protein